MSVCVCMCVCMCVIPHSCSHIFIRYLVTRVNYKSVFHFQLLLELYIPAVLITLMVK